MDKNAALMNLREFVEDHLVQWAESQRRISEKSNAREFAADTIEKGIEFLEAGINVVTIATIPMIYAPVAHVSWVNRIEAACEHGGASFYATGSEPGLCSMAVPAAMLGGAGVIDEYRMDLYATTLDVSYPLWEVLHESMAFGKPDGHVPQRSRRARGRGPARARRARRDRLSM